MHRSESSSRREEFLVRQAARGNEHALNILIRRWLPAAAAGARRFAAYGLEPEDLIQEGLIGLIGAVKTYRSDGTASFRTYARLCMNRSMLSALRAVRSQKRVPRGALVSIDDEKLPPIPSVPQADPQIAFGERDESETARFRIFRNLSPFEKKVLSAYLEGRSYREIAERLAVTRKAVDNAMWRIRRKLR